MVLSMIITSETLDLTTARGPMHTYVYRPANEGKYPGIIFYSEIFQQTEPVRRAAMLYAGHGFVVAVPEVFHEFEPAGRVLGYDQAGADAGNCHKYDKELASYDEDTAALIAHLTARPDCDGSLGAVGICLGGHLAFRAALSPEVRAAACFYATDIHNSTLGRGKADDSLARAGEIKGELLMIWGRQDPHIPADGRQKIYARLNEAGVSFTWHEFQGQHAFMRDEGHRYDPELALICYNLAISLLRRAL